MTHLICYFSGVLSDGEADRQREAIAHFGLSQNWPIPRNEKTRIPFLRSEWCFTEPTPGAALEEALRLAHDGSVFVIPSLATLGERPSRQQSIILGLLSKGARVYVMDLQGSVEPHLLALRTAWASARVMEQMHDEMAKRYAAREAEIVQERVAYENHFASRMAESFGVQSLVPKLTNGHDHSEPPISQPLPPDPEAPTPTAELLQNLYTKSGLSYQQIADRVGTSKTTINELLKTGRGTQLSKVLEVLRAAP